MAKFVANIIAFAIVIAIGAVSVGVVAVIYGYVDAYASSPTNADLKLRAKAISWWELKYDSMALWAPIKHGDVFIKLEWVPPEGKVLSKLTVTGSAWEGDHKLEDFDSVCQRGSTTNLRRNTVPASSFTTKIDHDPVCFIRLQTEFPFKTMANGEISNEELDRVHARAFRVHLRDVRYKAEVSNRQMRYITWTDDNIRALKTWIVSVVSYPFARE